MNTDTVGAGLRVEYAKPIHVQVLPGLKLRCKAFAFVGDVPVHYKAVRYVK